MKPFNLDLAKSGHPIVIRAGRPARFIAHVPEVANSATRVIVSVDEGNGLYSLKTYFESGKYIDGEENGDDLLHPVVKKSGWINLFAAIDNPDTRLGSKVWKSREYAEMSGKPQRGYITTIEIHWEE